ncbi:VanZ family protein [Bacillus gobiensis]|uniref:VanZ family protein n=1 Tax=Bacillus gobiensis TaxID=1441095 RepID=UPI003D1CCF4B
MKSFIIQLNTKKYVRIIFIIYLVMLLTVSFWGISMFFPRYIYYNEVSQNLMPFKMITNYLLNFEQYNFRTWFNNTFGLVLLFIPFGLLIPLVFADIKHAAQMMYLSFLVSLSLEIAQYITVLGVFDIDDVILNTFGGMLGFLIITQLIKRKKYS